MNADEILELRARMRAFAAPYVERGEPSAWFDAWYRERGGDEREVPWADLEGHPLLNEWLDSSAGPGDGLGAVVVGCGLGEEAEQVARRGFQVTAFDISSSAIEWCGRRFPGSRVQYLVADVLALPEDWSARFDLVVEVYTLQALPPEPRPRIQASLARLVAPGGRLLVITRGRGEQDTAEAIPWPLARSEMDRFVELGLREERFEDIPCEEDPPGRRFRALYRG